MNPALIAVLYGLGGAIGWGASNFFGGKSTREKNVIVTVFNSQLLLFVAMSIIVILMKPAINLSAGFLIFIVLNYLVFTLGLLVSYKAYAIGPISITAPIVGTYGLIVVGASVVIYDQVLKVNQWAGIALLFIGLVGATFERSRRKRAHFKPSGIVLALIAAVLLGIGLSGFVYAVGRVGWEIAVLLGYFLTASWAGLFLMLKGQLKRPYISKSVFGLAAFQILGTISFSVGVERSLAPIVVAVSSVTPLVTSLMGLMLFKEKIIRDKLIGVAFIIIGLILISV